MEGRLIRIICGVRLVDRISSAFFRERVVVFVQVKDIGEHSNLRWYGYIIYPDTDSQILEVMELEIGKKRKEGPPEKSWEK